jgi:hypothetical protein
LAISRLTSSLNPATHHQARSGLSPDTAVAQATVVTRSRAGLNLNVLSSTCLFCAGP